MRVLVVEDHPILAESLVDGLRGEGYAVDVASDGSAAEQMVWASPYDCMVLDLMLPKKDGLSVLREMRKRGLHTPVLCLTARDGVDDRVNGLNAGADDYLPKPFAWAELIARMRSLIRRTHGQDHAKIVVGDLEIDLVDKCARRGGRTITFTGKEFALLEYLAMRAGRVVSRSEIWDHIYDDADTATSNVMDVYIGYLRNKIDRGFGQKLIHTRRGQGYILTAQEEGCEA